VKKRALGFEAEGKIGIDIFRGEPRGVRSQREPLVPSFRVFGGQAPAMLAHFVSETALTPKEIAELASFSTSVIPRGTSHDSAPPLRRPFCRFSSNG